MTVLSGNNGILLSGNTGTLFTVMLYLIKVAPFTLFTVVVLYGNSDGFLSGNSETT